MRKQLSNFLLSLASFIKPAPQEQPPVIQLIRNHNNSFLAKYDSALSDSENERHWGLTDSLDADSANSLHVRRILRNRARYEYFSNCYCMGIIDTIATDTIRTGPRLQVLEEDEDLNEIIEEDFQDWANEISLAKKLRIIERSEIRDGECFILLFNNPRLDHPVKLDLMIYETDRVSAEFQNEYDTDRFIDGIQLDQFGNPVSYQVTKSHPGNTSTHNWETITYDARFVIHCFDPKRAESHRGIPEITPALPLFAQLRRYTLATLGAAEHSANYAGVLQTDLPPEMVAQILDPKSTMDVYRNMFVSVPAGWKLGQLESKNPNAQYSEFKNEILDEYARCISVPHNVASGNSSGYNFASGRLDWQNFEGKITVKRNLIEVERLRRVVNAFMEEYSLINPRVMSIDRFRRMRKIKHRWFWDQKPHVDPTKEAKSDHTRLRDRATTYSDVYAKQGEDWRKKFRQIAVEQEEMERLGIKPEDVEQNLSASLEDQVEEIMENAR